MCAYSRRGAHTRSARLLPHHHTQCAAAAPRGSNRGPNWRTHAEGSRIATERQPCSGRPGHVRATTRPVIIVIVIIIIIVIFVAAHLDHVPQIERYAPRPQYE